MISNGSTQLELMVRAAAREVSAYAEDVFHACSAMTERIKNIKGGKYIIPEYAYKATLTNDLTAVEVWHFRPNGDRDKLVLTITK